MKILKVRKINGKFEWLHEESNTWYGVSASRLFDGTKKGYYSIQWVESNV